MISKAFITGEIRLRIAEQIEQNEVCDVGIFCTAFLAEKRGIEGPDSDFYLACAAEFVRQTASKVIGKYRPQKTTSPQVAMKGFDHLQRAYPVVRSTRQMLVPIAMLSDEELLARATELDAMATGCTDHATEIRNYVRLRVDRGAA